MLLPLAALAAALLVAAMWLRVAKAARAVGGGADNRAFARAVERAGMVTALAVGGGALLFFVHAAELIR